MREKEKKENRKMKKKFKLQDLDCANCAAKMEDGIKKIPGVLDASVSFMMQKMTIEAEEDQFDRIAKRTAEVGALVIVDEAYHYFYDKTFLRKIFEYDNVILIRTFSKLFSIAALRLGFLVGNERLIHYIWNVRPTFDTNAVALKAGEILLKSQGLCERLIAVEREGRQYLIDSLAAHGYEYFAGNGNYAFIRTRIPVPEVRKRLEARKILIKTYSQEILSGFIRISTGSRPVMEQFTRALYEVDCECE